MAMTEVKTHKMVTLGYAPGAGMRYAYVELATGKVTGGFHTAEEAASIEAEEMKRISSLADATSNS